MTARRFLPLRRCWAIAIVSFSGLFSPAAALNHIRGELWSYQGDVPTFPLTSVINVTFFADMADMDLPSRVVFSIVVVDDQGQDHTLLQYKWGQWVSLPGAGTPIDIFASFFIWCDGEGNIVAQPVVANFGTCQGDREVHEFPNTQTFPVQVQGRFALILVDRDGYRGQNPTPPAALGCSGTTTTLSATSALQDIQLQKSGRANRVAAGENGSIGIYFDREGTMCTGRITPEETGTVYVIAKTAGMSECGLAGSEFKFEGIPHSWMTYPVAAPDLLALGDPFLEGVTMGFRCKRPDDRLTILYEVQVVASAVEEDLVFRVANRDPATNPNFSCPLLTLCDKPVFTKVCVEGLACVVNSTKPRKCHDPVAVSPVTWGHLKGLYR
jgi:hypothetical protein